ncbi:unnamed protein product [Closterium sp. Naga37s-1]|nr:unnamed protein product [Closterium sp. Naga37s-1]
MQGSSCTTPPVSRCPDSWTTKPNQNRGGGSREDLHVRSEPWRRPATSNPWNLAEGRRGVDERRRDDDVEMDAASERGDEEDGEEPQLTRGIGRHGVAEDDGSPTARGEGRRDVANDEEFPTARGGGRRDVADDEEFPTARGGGRRDVADDEEFPTARGGGRRDVADDEESPTARGGGRRDVADDEESPTARGGGRRDVADDEESPTARGGGSRDVADDRGLPTARGGAGRGDVDGKGKARAKETEGRRQVSSARLNQGQNMIADGAWRWAKVGRRIGRIEKKSRTTWGGASEARLSGSGGAMEKGETGTGEGDRRTVPERKEEAGSEGSKSSITRSVHLREERGGRMNRRGAGQAVRTT